MELTVTSSSEDGDITDATTVSKTAVTMDAYSEDSSGTFDVQAFMFFDTSSLPDHCEIVKVDLKVGITSFGVTGDPSDTYLSGFICDDACNGSTLDTGDWNRPNNSSQEFGRWALDSNASITTGTNTLGVWPGGGDFQTPAAYVAAGPQINRTGITNVRFVIRVPDIDIGQVTFATSEHSVAQKPQLVITYRLPTHQLPLLGVGRM